MAPINERHVQWDFSMARGNPREKELPGYWDSGLSWKYRSRVAFWECGYTLLWGWPLGAAWPFVTKGPSLLVWSFPPCLLQISRLSSSSSHAHTGVSTPPPLPNSPRSLPVPPTFHPVSSAPSLTHRPSHSQGNSSPTSTPSPGPTRPSWTAAVRGASTPPASRSCGGTS